MKTADYDYKYEAAKGYYAEGNYRKATEVFEQVLAVLRGTHYGDECLFMLGMSSYRSGDYESAAKYFKQYCKSYSKGHYVELSRYFSAMSHYNSVVDTRLDQTNTMDALNEFSKFLEYHPESKLRAQTQDMIFNLQDKLVEKEYMAAKLYYDLGTYRGNCMSYDDNNFEACIVTAQNALKDYPYASPERKEELSIMILRSRYHLARHSIIEKRVERFRDAIDEYYAFQNEFPESKYLKEAKSILNYSERVVAKKGQIDEDDVDLTKVKKEKKATALSDEEGLSEENINKSEKNTTSKGLRNLFRKKSQTI